MEVASSISEVASSVSEERWVEGCRSGVKCRVYVYTKPCINDLGDTVFVQTEILRSVPVVHILVLLVLCSFVALLRNL